MPGSDMRQDAIRYRVVYRAENHVHSLGRLRGVTASRRTLDPFHSHLVLAGIQEGNYFWSRRQHAASLSDARCASLVVGTTVYPCRTNHQEEPVTAKRPSSRVGWGASESARWS